MVVLNKIYTRTGDKGDTALGTGDRVAKHSPRVAAYGTSDELNSVVGLARLHSNGEMDAQLAAIQNDLFDLGADLCRPGIDEDDKAEYPPLRMIEAQVTRLETEIDTMNTGLEALRSFILPGGTPLAAHLHLARTTCRRAERLATELAEAEPGDVNPFAIRYLNRLSDWFFVAARVANGGEDVLWVPGGSR